MKRKAMFILSAMAMVAAVSCTKEIVDASKESASDVELYPMTFTASSQQTKAEMVDAQTIHWQAGDQINVFDGTSTVYDGPSLSFLPFSQQLFQQSGHCTLGMDFKPAARVV